MPGCTDPQAVNTILLDRESNPVMIRLDDGLGFSVDLHEGNLVLAELVAQSFA